MNDEDKNNSDLEETENFDDFDDAFEDDFNLEETSEASSAASQPSSKAESPAVSKKPSPPPKKSRSSLPIVIGLAIFCFFGWKLLQNFNGHSKKPVVEEQPAVAIATPTIEVVAEPVLKPEIETPVALSPQEPTSSQKELTQVESQLVVQEKQYEEKLQLLEKELAFAKQNAETSARTLEEFKHDLLALTTAIQQLNEQVDNLREYQEREILRKEQTKSVAKPKREATHHAEQGSSLTVYAIIPGRAWLRSPNGKTLTVTEGDTLAEFGKVLKIDASNGVVITTSGVTLR